MDYDTALVVGLVVGIFSVPAAVSAIAEHRAPRIAAVALIVSGGLVAWAVTQNPSGYAIGDIPNVVVKVIGRLVN